MDIIKQTYNDPEFGLQSAEKLFLKLRNKGITKKQIDDFLKKQETSQTINF